jgi:FMN reductase [NAD(P)H]
MTTEKPTKTREPYFPGYAADEANPVIDCLVAHRSVRKFKDEPISQEALDRILTAAQRAPTSSNMQAYSIIVIDDRALREKLRELSAHQEFIADCAVLLIFCADISRLVRVCEGQGYTYRGDRLNSLMTGHGDSLLACQNAAIAAESMGLGNCMLGNIRQNPQQVSDLLELPRHVFATVGLAIGVPDQNPGIKPRLSRSVVVSRNRYSTCHLEDGLAEYDRVTCAAGIYGGRPEPLPGAGPHHEETFTADTYGWVEHTARRMTADHSERWREFDRFIESKEFGRKA